MKISAALLLSFLVGAQAVRKKGVPPKKGQPTAWDGKDFFPLVEAPDPNFIPHPPKDENYSSKDTTIYVGISGFRDSRCPKTLYNLYTKAENPARVFVGLVQQNAEGDVDCVDKYCELMGYRGQKTDAARARPAAEGGCPYFAQIRANRVSHLLARGPTFGRHLQVYLLRDEQFCMQIDSHMDFMDHWDTLNLEHWGLARNEYAVLTTYVHKIEDLNRNINNRWEVPNICKLRFVDGGLPRNGDAFSAFHLSRPKLGSLWAAGFSFMRCHGERQVPYDPQLPNIFDGEEFSRSARLWTRGYDFYTPHRPVVVHDYNKPKDYNPQGWRNNNQQNKEKDKARSRQRIFDLLEMPEGTSAGKAALGKYGLGDRRSLAQYEAFVGVSLKRREMLENHCGTLQWVPFEEDLEALADFDRPLRFGPSGEFLGGNATTAAAARSGGAARGGGGGGGGAGSAVQRQAGGGAAGLRAGGGGRGAPLAVAAAAAPVGGWEGKGGEAVGPEEGESLAELLRGGPSAFLEHRFVVTLPLLSSLEVTLLGGLCCCCLGALCLLRGGPKAPRGGAPSPPPPGSGYGGSVEAGRPAGRMSGGGRAAGGGGGARYGVADEAVVPPVSSGRGRRRLAKVDKDH